MKEAAESWEAYKKRLKTRHKLGKSADKLVRMVDRFLPKVAAETRVFIMRFPHEIPDLLKQARKIRRRAKARHQRGEASASRASASATPDNMEKLGGNATTPSTSMNMSPPSHDDQRGGERLLEVDPQNAGDATHHAIPELQDLGEEVDWGGSHSEADSASSPHADEQKEQEPARDLGEMRPRTPSRSPPRPTPLGAQRPRTPSRSPRRAVLQPGPMWRNIRRIQDHMQVGTGYTIRERRSDSSWGKPAERVSA